MAKFEEPFQDVQSIFDELIEISQLDRVITVKLLCDDKQKVIGKVMKANDVVKHLSGVDVIVIINQKIFDQLPYDLQKIQASEILAGVGFDYDKDKIVIKKGDINTFSGLLRVHGYDVYERLLESVKTLYNASNNEDI